MLRSARGLICGCVAASVVAACGGQTNLAPVTTVEAGSTGPGDSHTVRKGETVYAIAWRYGFDYRALAKWNQLSEPYIIYPGQNLALRGEMPVELKSDSGLGRAQTHPAGRAGTINSRPVEAARSLSAPVKRTPTAAKEPPSAKAKPIPKASGAAQGSSSAAKPAKAAKAQQPSVPKSKAVASGTLAKSSAKLDNAKLGAWLWPTKGKLIGSFGGNGGSGVDIAGGDGQAVKSAHDGAVVYRGSGLIGYGKLIIVKHNKRYLSAYAHNRAIHVKEGDLVKRGQRIAEMGSSGTDRGEATLRNSPRRQARQPA